MKSILEQAVYNNIRAYCKYMRIYEIKKEYVLSSKAMDYTKAKVQNTSVGSYSIEEFVDLKKQIDKSFKVIIDCMKLIPEEYHKKIIDFINGRMDFCDLEDRKNTEKYLSDLIDNVKEKVYGELLKYER